VTATLVYDGDCGFCTSSVRVLRRLRLRADEVVAYQHADLAALGLTEEQCRSEVQWVDGGRRAGGHEAFARLLLASALPWRPLGALLLVPPVSWLARRLYTWIADHRGSLPGGTPACALPQEDRPRAS
jgi:predicted DCC family thiol-disulfide oxidoreductase YuxK